MRPNGWIRLSSASVTLAVAAARAAVGQVPDTISRQFAAVVGRVVDSSGAGLGGAEVMVLAGDTPVVVPTLSDSQGRFDFRRVPAGGPYTLIARKMGYKPARGRGIRVQAGDTLRLRFVLDPTVVVLNPITVKGRRRSRSSIYADEFAQKVKVFRDALALMVWYRPFMLGDPEFCSPPDSFGRPLQDRARVRITERIALYTGSSQGGSKHRPWIEALRFGNGIDDPPLPYVRQVYVNGLRVDRPGDPLRTPLRMLRAIPSRHIAEMHYADCWNNSVPVGMQYTIFVTLKPLTPAQQDSMFRFVLAQAAPSGPIEGKVASFKRPSREVWDSIVRSLTGRDSLQNDSAKAATSP